MKKALAFDIGGTKIYSTIIDENGVINISNTNDLNLINYNEII